MQTHTIQYVAQQGAKRGYGFLRILQRQVPQKGLARLAVDEDA